MSKPESVPFLFHFLIIAAIGLSSNLSKADEYFSYDESGNIVKKRVDGEVTLIEYDLSNRLESAISARGAVKHSIAQELRDQFDRLAEVTAQVWVLAHSGDSFTTGNTGADSFLLTPGDISALAQNGVEDTDHLDSATGPVSYDPPSASSRTQITTFPDKLGVNHLPGMDNVVYEY